MPQNPSLGKAPTGTEAPLRSVIFRIFNGSGALRRLCTLTYAPVRLRTAGEMSNDITGHFPGRTGPYRGVPGRIQPAKEVQSVPESGFWTRTHTTSPDE